jgi:hypothetical protein
MSELTPLTATNMLTAASEALLGASYRPVSEETLSGKLVPGMKVFEDVYTIVGVVVYETWSELANCWQDAQANIVQLISDHIGAAEPKAWDGYLVLLTPSLVDDPLQIEAIRYNTTRLRKLVGTGRDLRRLGDIQAFLAPLLPIETDLDKEEPLSVLDSLPGILAEKGIPEGATRTLLEAFHSKCHSSNIYIRNGGPNEIVGNHNLRLSGL